MQLSGIGPRHLLSDLGIDVVEDLPGVGFNFQDQPNYYFIFNFTNFPGDSPDWLWHGNNATFEDYASELYYTNRTGPYTLVFESGTSVTYLSLPSTTSSYQSIISAARKVNLSSTLPTGADESILAGYQAQVDIILDLYASPNATVQETTLAGSTYIPVALLKPLSRGSISINSTDPFADPVFDFGTYMHPTDIAVGIASVRKNREVIGTPAMQELGTSEIAPGPQYTSDSDIAAQLQKSTLSSWQHPSGSLSMMPRSLGGVVDAELRVYGVKGLRVVDASIFPIIPATHTTPAVYAVAEKVSTDMR